MALRGLYKLKELPPMEDAVKLSKNESMDVRRYLCLSLQSQRNPEFIPLLTRLRKDPDFNVRLDASRALKGLGPLSDPEGF
jgi:HEAT repeat protein